MIAVRMLRVSPSLEWLAGSREEFEVVAGAVEVTEAYVPTLDEAYRWSGRLYDVVQFDPQTDPRVRSYLRHTIRRATNASVAQW